MNNRSGIMILIAVILVAIAFYRWDDIRAGAQYLNSLQLPTAQHPAPTSDPIAGQHSTPTPTPAPSPTPWDWSTPFPIYETGSDEPAVAPVTDRQESRGPRAPATCEDATPLTVTRRTRNGYSYRCGSGREGNYACFMPGCMN